MPSPPPNPIKVSSTRYLGDVKSDLPVVRDLGFVGRIDDTVIYTYGDTLTAPGAPNWWMTSDSSSISSGDPCYVLNTQRTSDGNHPTDLIPPQERWGETNTEYGFAASTVIPTGKGEGMMFYHVYVWWRLMGVARKLHADLEWDVGITVQVARTRSLGRASRRLC